nr:5'/3'-nucleotidase SurE [Pelomonas sp. Root1217]
MRILISNDDGYLAPGLEALVKACDALMPEGKRSGSAWMLPSASRLFCQQSSMTMYW